MPFLIEKITPEFSNERASFCLTHSDNPLINLEFSKKTFRFVLSEFGFSSGTIGHVVTILNRLYPSPVVRPSEDQRYTDNQLINFLRSVGLHVQIKEKIDVISAIKILEKRGYKIKGQLKDVFYTSPEYLVTRN